MKIESSTATRRGISLSACVAFGITFLVGLIVVSAPRIASATVTEQVRTDVPIVLDGEVWAVEQVGSTVVVGGNFTQVQISRNGPVVNQAAIFAYDLDSGTFIDSFRPILGRDAGLAEVRDLVANADGTGVYLGGAFDSVNDGSDGQFRVRNRLALLDVQTGRLDRNFSLGGVNAQVNSLDLDQWGRLYVGGNFDIVYDLAPARSPIEQPVRGIARLDAATGQFDQGFRYESHVDIGRFGLMGVSRVVLNPNDGLLFIAHRGAEIRNAVTGEVFDSPGIGRIRILADRHFATQYKVLHPDADDPIQEFYHGGVCDGVGLQIRDMDVESGYLVVVHQGADRGAQCDTTVRFPSGRGEHRPDWVSRAFDSIFSVEIDGDDIYIGGHFRYLVNDSAPSPYPGRTAASGQLFPNQNARQLYVADPGVDANFRTELVEPGYVYVANQLGVLDAATGFGDPSFNPGSNAGLGVLDLTAIDRGLLLGQDNDRVNDVLTGRSAFFDNDPTAGRPQCSVTRGDAGVPIVSWTNIGDVNRWSIAVNGVFRTTVDGTATEFADVDAERGEPHTYELRYSRNGLSLTDQCGSIERPIPTLTCSARLSGDEAIVNWNDQDWDRVSVRRNGSFLTEVDPVVSIYSEIAPVGTTTYAVRAFIGAERFEVACGSPITVAPPAPPELACSASLVGDEARLEWNDEGWDRVSIRRNGKFLSTVNDGAMTFSETAPTGTTTYAVRAFSDGERFETECSPNVVVAAPTLVCTLRINNAGALIVRWNDIGASSYQIRTNGFWTASLPAGTVRYVTESNGDTIEVRFRVNGETLDVLCT